jgi:hypothetical protein
LKSFRRQRGIDLEHELRAGRPEPRPEFLAMIGERVAEGRSRTHGRVRIAFGAALTAGMLAAVAAVGGVGFAASSVHKVAKSVVRITHTSHPRVVNGTSAANQYNRNVNVCYKGKVITIKESQLPSFRAKGAKVTSAKKGSKCAFRANKKGRRHGAPAFTG